MRKVYADFGDGLRLEMPSVETVRNHALAYPDSLARLIRLRSLLADRYIDYNILSGLDDDARKDRLAQMLLSGLDSVGAKYGN